MGIRKDRWREQQVQRHRGMKNVAPSESLHGVCFAGGQGTCGKKLETEAGSRLGRGVVVAMEFGLLPSGPA